MHPLLNAHLHPTCQEVIEQLQQCHSKHYIGKFFGFCNNARLKLDQCLQESVCIFFSKLNIFHILSINQFLMKYEQTYKEKIQKARKFNESWKEVKKRREEMMREGDNKD